VIIVVIVSVPVVPVIIVVIVRVVVVVIVRVIIIMHVVGMVVMVIVRMVVSVAITIRHRKTATRTADVSRRSQDFRVLRWGREGHSTRVSAQR